MFGTSALSFISIVSPASMNNICGQLGKAPGGYPHTSTLDFVNSAGDFNGQPSPTNVICSQLISPLVGNPPTSTQGIDYGLTSSFIILANVTNQAVSNFNAFYIFSGMVGFLKAFKSATSVSWSEATSVEFSYQPPRDTTSYGPTSPGPSGSRPT